MRLSTKISCAGPKFLFLCTLTSSCDQVSVVPVKQFLYLPCHAARYQWDLSNSLCTYPVMQPGISGICQTVFVLTVSCDQVSVGPVKQFLSFGRVPSMSSIKITHCRVVRNNLDVVIENPYSI